MSEHRDEKWLDELISGSIDTSEPKFAPEQWKQKYPGQFRALVERRGGQAPAGRFGVLGAVLRSRVAQLSVAATVIIAVGLLALYLGRNGQDRGPAGQRL